LSHLRLLKYPIHGKHISLISSVFLIISPKTRRLLSVGKPMRVPLGYSTDAFLGGKWDLVSALVVKE